MSALIRFSVISLAAQGVLASVAGIASAQTPAPSISLPGAFDAESRRQQQRLEQQLQQPRPGAAADSVSAPQRKADEVAPSGGPKFLLKKVEFDKSEFLTPAELAQTTKGLVGKEVDLADLHRILAAVNKLYAERRIVTAVATLPPQDVGGGVVHIKLTEGRLGQMIVSGTTYMSKDFVLDRVAMSPGTVIDPNKLSEQMTRFNRLHDVQLKALLQPGSSFGLSDVQLAVTELPINTLQLFTDNQGVRSTGKYQLGGLYRRNGIFGVDDRFTLYATNARQTVSGNASYNMPIGTEGTRVGVSYSRGLINIVDGPMKALDVQGESQTVALNASHPLWVNANWLIQANASGSLGAAETKAMGNLITDDETRKGTSGVTVTYYGSNFVVSISPALAAVEATSNLLDRTRDFGMFTGTAMANIQLPYGLRLTSNASWQTTAAELLPGDQLFQIGGPTTVRGYPTNSASGDKGYLVNAELHRDLGELVKGLDVFVFLDHGAVYTPHPGRRVAVSTGIGAAWTPRPETTLEVSAARPLHDLVPTQSMFEIYGRLIWRPKI